MIPSAHVLVDLEVLLDFSRRSFLDDFELFAEFDSVGSSPVDVRLVNSEGALVSQRVLKLWIELASRDLSCSNGQDGHSLHQSLGIVRLT